MFKTEQSATTCLLKRFVIKDQAAASAHFLTAFCVCVLCQAHALDHYVVNLDYRPEGQEVRNSKHTTHKTRSLPTIFTQIIRGAEAAL